MDDLGVKPLFLETSHIYIQSGSLYIYIYTCISIYLYIYSYLSLPDSSFKSHLLKLPLVEILSIYA